MAHFAALASATLIAAVNASPIDEFNNYLSAGQTSTSTSGLTLTFEYEVFNWILIVFFGLLLAFGIFMFYACYLHGVILEYRRRNAYDQLD